MDYMTVALCLFAGTFMACAMTDKDYSDAIKISIFQGIGVFACFLFAG